MTKEFWKAALNRALRTVAQTLVGAIPTGFMVTANMIKTIDLNVLWVILAWLATGLLAGAMSILTSIATGLPETNPVIEYRYLDENGAPIDGHYALVHNIEEECNETCDLSKYLGDDGDETGNH